MTKPEEMDVGLFGFPLPSIKIRKSALSAKVMCCPDKLTHLAQFLTSPYTLMNLSTAEARSIPGVPHCMMSLPRPAGARKHLVSCKIKDDKVQLVDFGQCLPKNIYRRDLLKQDRKKSPLYEIEVCPGENFTKLTFLHRCKFFLVKSTFLHYVSFVKLAPGLPAGQSPRPTRA